MTFNVVRYDALDVEIPNERVKIVTSLLPAYRRYFQFAGVALEHRKNGVLTRVYGFAPDCSKGLVLWRPTA